MEATAGNSILDFETLFSDFQELLNASGLRWGWVFLERTRILSGIQFTTHFIDFFVVETKRFVGSTVQVILTQQTCGQRSSRPVESKRRALGNYFFKRICCMFLMSKCRGDWDLGLCTTSVLAFGELQRNDQIQFFLCRNTFFPRKSPLHFGSSSHTHLNKHDSFSTRTNAVQHTRM